MIWKILGIEKTKDENLIKAAYREKLRYVNPEDDEEGFKELRCAYEEAIEYASLPEEIETDEKDKDGMSEKWLNIMKNSIITTGGKYKVAEDGVRVIIAPGVTRTYVIYDEL